MPDWVPDVGWRGTWELPPALRRPLAPHKRAALVAWSVGGAGPAKLVDLAQQADEGRGDWPGSGVGADVLAQLAAAGVRAVTPADHEYPKWLLDLAAPPPLLYVRGAELSSLEPAVAVVGARACTAGGKRFARRLGAALGRAGFTVVSGLARGIDGAAHRGATEGGRSVAVVATGLDRCYPPEHADLLEAIVAGGGAVVSEFPPGVGPRPWHFPARNRLVAGLALAVVVVEAGERSGALITAGFALDGGREVFACITGPENPAGAGVRAMLLDGAPMIVDAAQAVEDLVDLARLRGYQLEGGAVGGQATPNPTQAPPNLTGARLLVWESVGGSSVDEVAEAAALDPVRAAAVLAELELAGLVEARDGRWWPAGD